MQGINDVTSWERSIRQDPLNANNFMYSLDHETIAPIVYIDQSGDGEGLHVGGVEPLGRGLIADREYEKGEHIFHIVGEVRLSLQDGPRSFFYPKRILNSIATNHYIDDAIRSAEDEERGKDRYLGQKFPQFDTSGWIIIDETSPLWYVNHRCNGANLGRPFVRTVTAMRDIKEGEELTLPYHMHETCTEWKMRCRRSGCDPCLGEVRGILHQRIEMVA